MVVNRTSRKTNAFQTTCDVTVLSYYYDWHFPIQLIEFITQMQNSYFKQVNNQIAV